MKQDNFFCGLLIETLCTAHRKIWTMAVLNRFTSTHRHKTFEKLSFGDSAVFGQRTDRLHAAV